MLARPSKRVFNFDFFSENQERHNIIFNSVFDSGNLCLVEQITSNSYILHTSPDFAEANNQSICRSWFYFSIQGPPSGTVFSLTIKRINILYQLFRLAPETYKPVYRIGDGPWKRLEQAAKLIEDTTERTIDVQFDFSFGQDDSYNEKKEVFFAFSYPFSYKECQDMVTQYQETFTDDPDIYFHHEIFIRSPHKRRINLLTISSHDDKLEETESFFHPSLFPNREQTPRPHRFASSKPLILITARVHPGESPSSYAMNGVLKFLLDKENPQAQVLRQNFVFLIIPMLNPDGVYNGYYRLDIHGQNLNRHYRVPDYEKQPANYAVKKLVHHLHGENRLFFYSDLHSHASTKGCFFYGNALSTNMQHETFLFARLMEINHPSFLFDHCNFSRKHMNTRDRGEKLTKEGAGRVCVYRICNIPHSYTLECGFHYYSTGQLTNRYETSSIESIPSPSKNQITYFTNHTYEEVGKALLISVLDICEKNPSSELFNTRYSNLQGLKAEVTSNYSKQSFDGSPLRARCPSLSGAAIKPPITEVVKEIPAKKLPEVPNSEKRAISLSQTNTSAQLNSKRTKPFNSNLYAKIGELLNSMVLDRSKTMEAPVEPEPKPVKLKKLITPKKIKLKKLAFEPPVVSCPAAESELMVSVDDEKRKQRDTLPRLWESGVLEAQKSLMYESIQSEGQGGFLVQPPKEKEGRHRGRLLTYRGQNFNEVLNSVDSPKIPTEVIKKDSLPAVGQCFSKQPKAIKKKHFLKPLIRAIVIKKTLAKRGDSNELRPLSKTAHEELDLIITNKTDIIK